MDVNTIITIFAIATCATLVQCAPRTEARRATQHPHGHNNHHTQAPHNWTSDSIQFYYDANFHSFVAATTSTCFMAPLTRDEQDHARTNLGMEDIELRMMREWIGQLPETKVYHDDNTLPPLVLQWCAKRDIYLLERSLTTQPMSTM